MRAGLIGLLCLGVGACASAPSPVEPGVRVEVALVDGVVQPPVFRWDAPVAARVTVHRRDRVVWEVAEADTADPSRGVRRGPIVPPLTYGATGAAPGQPPPRELIPPAPLQPRTVYRVTVLGYDGEVAEGRFSVQERVAVR